MAAKNDILLDLGIAKIKVAVLQPDLLIGLTAVIDLKRKVRIAAAPENCNALWHDLDLTGGLLGVLRASLSDRSLYGNRRFLGDGLKLVHHVFALDHDLRRAVEITKNSKAEIGRNHAKVFQPSGQLNLFAGVTDAEFSAGMST